jgi:hypothetical protein
VPKVVTVKKTEKGERFHLLMPSKTKHRIETLQERTGAGSMTEVIRYALALYDLVSKQTIEEGKELVVRDPKTKEEQPIKILL